MKATALCILFFGFGLAAAAQSDQADLSKDLPEIPLERVEPFIYFEGDRAKRLPGQMVVSDGVIPKIKRTANPLQLINPLAPAEYGNAFDNVAVNPATGRPEGIHIFAIKF